MAGRSRFIGVAIPEEETPSLTCTQCDFVVHESSKHPVNSLRTHIRRAHEGWTGSYEPHHRAKQQFLAIMGATGSFSAAIEFAEQILTWDHPGHELLRVWAEQAEEAELDGKPLVTEAQVERMDRRLRRAQEWQSRLALKYMTQASMRLSKEIIDTGTTDKPQLMQYTGMNVSYMNKEISNAYSAPRPAQANLNQIVINAGEPPPRLKAVTVEAESVRELGSGADV